MDPCVDTDEADPGPTKFPKLEIAGEGCEGEAAGKAVNVMVEAGVEAEAGLASLLKFAMLALMEGAAPLGGSSEKGTRSEFST